MAKREPAWKAWPGELPDTCEVTGDVMYTLGLCLFLAESAVANMAPQVKPSDKAKRTVFLKSVAEARAAIDVLREDVASGRRLARRAATPEPSRGA